MKLLVSLSRILVGGLFIFSGLIKLNDPMGFAFKLQDYFAPDVLNLDFLSPHALWMAVFIVVFEVLLGVMILIGFARRFTVWSLLLMIVFFTFLTFYSAYFNKVTDCGCFGDAIKLTPWESFTKDVILLVFILILFVGRKHITPIFPKRAYLVGATAVICLFISYQVLNHLPYIDFRAYKVGTNIPEAMSIPSDAPRAIYDITFIYDVGGQEKSYTQNELSQVPAGATFVDRKQKLIQEGYTPPILDLTIEDEEGDRIDYFMTREKLLVVILYNLENSNPKGFANIKEITDQARRKGYTVIGLSASVGEAIDKLRANHELDFDFYYCDQTVLKTIVRSNPGVVVLERGTIKQKKHWKDALDIEL